jgi:peptide/nickel transport system permease protein
MKAALAWLRVVRRAAIAAGIVTLLSWTLVECAPGSTAERAAIASRAFDVADAQMPSPLRARIVDSVAERHGLDGHVAVRMARNLAGVLILDFGRSWQDEESVAKLILAKAGLRTALLCFLALLLAVALGLWGATASARRGRKSTDAMWSFYAALILSLPVPWLAMLAIRTFAYGHPFSFVPPGGMDSIGQAILPILLLASAPTAVIWRHAREEMRAQYASDWVLAARARGTQPDRLWRVYILRCALPTVLALVPALLAYLLAASIIVERVFAIEGVGDLLARAAAAGDAPVLIAAAAISAALISLASSGVDALAEKIDPRRSALS